jgi:hypothetical protein
MLPAILIFGLAFGCIQLGRAGFSDKGIPFDGVKYVTGKPARIIGIICFILGGGLAVFGLIGLVVGFK